VIYRKICRFGKCCGISLSGYRCYYYYHY